jgi:hypothetical protein
MSAPEEAAGPDPSRPGPGPHPEQEQGDALDLQAIRLDGVTATAITARPGAVIAPPDVKVLDRVTGHLFALLDEVERLQHEVATREAAARHAFDAATLAWQQVEGFRVALERAQDERAEAYLIEVQCWDLLGRAHHYVPGPGDEGEDHDSRQLNHDIGVQLQADPAAAARALWGRLRTAEVVCAAVENPGCVCAPPPLRVRDALTAWKAARAVSTDG